VALFYYHEETDKITHYNPAYLFKSLSNSQCPVKNDEKGILNFDEYSPPNSIDENNMDDVFVYELNDVICISATNSTLQWMFRGDLNNFPQIQFIILPLESNTLCNETSVLNFLDDSVGKIMKTFSCVNQILVSGHFSILLNTNLLSNSNDVLINAAAKKLPDPQLVNSFDDTISLWFKKSALKNQMNSHYQSFQDFIYDLTSKTGFITLKSTEIDKTVFELKLKNMKADYNSIRNEIIVDIDNIKAGESKPKNTKVYNKRIDSTLLPNHEYIHTQIDK